MGDREEELEGRYVCFEKAQFRKDMDLRDEVLGRTKE